MSNALGDKIKDLHSQNLSGVYNIIKSHRTLYKKPFIFCVLISVLICLYLSIFKIHNSFFYLQTITDLIISVFPNLLGFSLGGYAIIVGFSNTDLIRKATTIKKHSIYQILSGIFAFAILFQVFCVVISFIVSFLIKTHMNEMFNMPNNFVGDIINIFVFLCMFFASLYSLVLTPYIVFNLFDLSQMNNFHYTMEELPKLIENDKKETPTN